MRKIGIGIFCVALCLAIALILPHLGRSSSADIDDLFKWELLYFGAHSADGAVDSSNCLAECHGGENPYPSGQIHSVSTHTACDSCHDGAFEAGNVFASACIVCHPLGDAGKCPLVEFHDPGKGAICLSCHTDCGGETTTTTTVSQTTVKGKRYEVFLVGPFEGCSATTMNFRLDNILILECIDGYGVYLPILNFFTAFFWAPNFYLGGGVFLILSGVGLDPFITAGGIAYFGNEVSPVVLTGYLLSTP